MIMSVFYWMVIVMIMMLVAIWRNVEEFGDVGGDDAKDVGLQSGERCNWCDWCSRCTHPPKVAILHKINLCNTCGDRNCAIHVVQIKEN